jgi:hypothetical protein
VATFRIVWDVLFQGDTVTTKGTDSKVAEAMDSHCPDQKVESALRWNTVLSGQKTSRAGFTSGLRYLIPVDHLSSNEIQSLLDSLSSFTHESCASSSCTFSESLGFPLSRSAKLRFPSQGRIALLSEFTHGLGYTDLKQIQNAKNTQTKETKEGLDPIGTGKGSSGRRFSEEFRSSMSDSRWFLVLSTSTEEGYKPPNEILSGGSDGGMYDLAFDLRDSISTLVDASKGSWWQPLDSDDLTLNPQLTLDPSDTLETPFDPAHYHHHDEKAQGLADKVLDVEIEQTGDEMMRDDLEYTLQRLTRSKRPSRQITGNEHGLVPGLEEHLISEHIIKPWLSEEFFNCLAFFLMTRKPKYWRNGKSKIQLLHPVEGLDIDLLMDQ